MSGDGGRVDIADDILTPAGREPVLISRETVVCPVCGRRSLDISVYAYEAPQVGLLALLTGSCRFCGFKYRDVQMAEASKPKRIIVRVLGEEQLRYIVVKPAQAKIVIPEQGYEVSPGPASVGFITTVEGILNRIMEALEVACSDPGADQEACKRHREWLSGAINGGRRFTLVMCDYWGVGKILGDQVEEKDLDDECDMSPRLWGEGQESATPP